MTKEICPIVSDFDNEISYVRAEARIKSGGRLSTPKNWVRRSPTWSIGASIAEHAVEETLEYTGLGGKIQHKTDPKAHRQAKQWYKIVRGLRAQGAKFLKTHRSEDLETALKALEIAAGSFEEVAERYE